MSAVRHRANKHLLPVLPQVLTALNFALQQLLEGFAHSVAATSPLGSSPAFVHAEAEPPVRVAPAAVAQQRLLQAHSDVFTTSQAVLEPGHTDGASLPQAAQLRQALQALNAGIPG